MRSLTKKYHNSLVRLFTTLSLLGLVVFWVSAFHVSSQGVTLVNGDFESGSLTGWKTIGEVSVTNDYLDPETNESLHSVADGNYAARIGDSTAWQLTGTQQSSIEQVVSLPSTLNDTDIFQFFYAVVANDPPDHPQEDKPRFRVQVVDLNTGRNLIDTDYIYTSQSSGEWYLGRGGIDTLISGPFYIASNDRWVFKPWTEVKFTLKGLAGHQLKILFEARDCNWGAHPLYGYLDAISIGQPKLVDLPDLEGNPAPAQYINPYPWSPVMNFIEKNGLVLLCCCLLPILIPLILLLWWLFTRKRKRNMQPVSTYSLPERDEADDVKQVYGADKKITRK